MPARSLEGKAKVRDDVPNVDADRILDTATQQPSQTRSLFDRLKSALGTTFVKGIPVIGPIITTVTTASQIANKVSDVNTITPDKVFKAKDLKKNGKNALSSDDNSTKSGEGAVAGNEAANLTGVTDSRPIEVEPDPNFDGEIPDNVLNPFINQQYHIVLSMIPNSKLPRIQRNIPAVVKANNPERFNEIEQKIDVDKSVVIASTGDVFGSENIELNLSELVQTGEVILFDEDGETVQNPETENLTTRSTKTNYYNITNFEIENMVSPSGNNPYISTMMVGKMTLAGPHEFQLAETIRRLGDEIGYSNINPGRYIFRIDIFFSGYNHDTGEWTPIIGLATRGGSRKCGVISYYVAITNIEANVSHTGTIYNISLAPNGHVAYRPEEMTVEASSIFTGEKGAQNRVQTFGGFLKKLETNLNESVKNRTHDQIKRNFVFHAPEQLRNASFFEDEFASKHGFIGQDAGKGSVVSTGKGLSVLEVIETALNDMEVVWNSFLRENDPQFKKPRIHWGIRFNTIYENTNPDINDYSTITLEYIVEPFASYKKATYENTVEAARIVDPASQVARIEEMIRLGMINRVYNYMHTSENTEVIDFNIDLKAFYYAALYDQSANSTQSGVMVGNAASNTQNHNNAADQTVGTKVADSERVTNRRVETTIESSLERIFGRGLDAPPAKCVVTGGALGVLGGGFHELAKPQAVGSDASEANQKKNKHLVQLNDHLNNDLAKIDLTVRGDPIWLLSLYATESGQTLVSTDDKSLSGQFGRVLVQPNASRVIFLKIFAPAQNDFINPDRQVASTSCSVIGGFFEVWTVKSTFEGGKFTQVLTAAKINHLNYVENFIGRVRQTRRETINRTNQNAALLKNSQPTDEAIFETIGLA